MLTSLLANNHGNHRIYLFYHNLQKKSISELRQVIEKGNSVLFPIPIGEELFSGYPVSGHFSVEIYYRLLAFSLLPQDLDRVLWLDADMIINGNIKDLYSSDFQEKWAVVCEAVSTTDNQSRLGLSREHCYFNSGMILFHLEELRKNLTEKDVFCCIRQNQEKLLWPDQDVLNILYQGKVLYADRYLYNYQTYGRFIDQEWNYEKGLRCSICHYVGEMKPWVLKCSNPLDKLFFRYSRMLRPVWTVGMKLIHFAVMIKVQYFSSTNRQEQKAK